MDYNMKKINQQPSSLFVNNFHKKFFIFQPDHHTLLTENGFAVCMDRKLCRAQELCAMSGVSVHTVKTGVKSEESCRQE